MNKLPQSHQGKEKTGYWLLNPASKIESILLSLFILLLPTQFGKHFWPDFSIVSGIRIDYLSPIVYVTDVLLVLLFFSFFIRLGGFSQNSKLKTQIFFIAGLVLVVLISNIVFANRPLLSLYGFVKLCEFAFLATYLAKTIRYPFQLQYISLLFVISSLFESLLAIFQYINQGSLNGIFYFFGERYFTGDTPGIANASIGGTLILRPYATFPHPNVLAAFLLIAMALIWHFVLKSSIRWMKMFGGIALVVDSIALLLSFSRTNIFLWTVFLVVLLWRLLFRQVKPLKTRISIAVSVVIVLVIAAALPIVHDVVLRFLQTSLSDESVTERTELLGISWKMILQHPIFGVGLDNFIPAMAPLQKPLPLEQYLQPVHNIFVLFLAETGVTGFGLFVWLLVATVKRIKNHESGIKNILLCLLVIILVTGMFDHYWLTLQQGQLLFAMIIGLSWAKLQKI